MAGLDYSLMFLPLKDSLPMSLLWEASMYIYARAIPQCSQNLCGENEY